MTELLKEESENRSSFYSDEQTLRNDISVNVNDNNVFRGYGQHRGYRIPKWRKQRFRGKALLNQVPIYPDAKCIYNSNFQNNSNRPILSDGIKSYNHKSYPHPSIGCLEYHHFTRGGGIDIYDVLGESTIMHFAKLVRLVDTNSTLYKKVKTRIVCPIVVDGAAIEYGEMKQIYRNRLYMHNEIPYNFFKFDNKSHPNYPGGSKLMTPEFGIGDMWASCTHLVIDGIDMPEIVTPIAAEVFNRLKKDMDDNPILVKSEGMMELTVSGESSITYMSATQIKPATPSSNRKLTQLRLLASTWARILFLLEKEVKCGRKLMTRMPHFQTCYKHLVIRRFSPPIPNFRASDYAELTIPWIYVVETRLICSYPSRYETDPRYPNHPIFCKEILRDLSNQMSRVVFRSEVETELREMPLPDIRNIEEGELRICETEDKGRRCDYLQTMCLNENTNLKSVYNSNENTNFKNMYFSNDIVPSASLSTDLSKDKKKEYNENMNSVLCHGKGIVKFYEEKSSQTELNLDTVIALLESMRGFNNN